MADDFGLKVSQPGIPVNLAGDFQLLYSSSWFNLRILKQGREYQDVVTIDGRTWYRMEHNLGFAPFYLFYSDGVLIKGATLGEEAGFVDEKYIYKDSPERYYFIFLVPIDQEYLSPTVRQSRSVRQGYSPDFGIRIVKENKDINSKDLRDFILHSRTLSPTVHIVKTFNVGSAVNDGIYNVFHGLDYTPLIFGFAKRINLQDKWVRVDTSETEVPKLVRSRKTREAAMSFVRGDSVSGISLVILKDPFFNSADQRIVY